MSKKSAMAALAFLLAIAAGLAGCGGMNGAATAPSATGATEHRYLTGDEAKKLYDDNPGVILLDVRTDEEYAAGHIEGSVVIPVTDLGNRLSELPDKGAIIIVFCRSGNRSGTAYKLLTDAGYTNVYDMQMVSNWPLPLVTSD